LSLAGLGYVAQRTLEMKKEGGAMTKPQRGAKQEDIDVVLLCPDPLQFRLESSLIKKGMLRFRNNKHPGFDLHFTLDDQAGSGYRFPTDPKQALASCMIDGSCAVCPPRNEIWPEFEAYESDGTTLKVYNENSTETVFGFTLFLEKAGAPNLALDPIGDDMNGPRS